MIAYFLGIAVRMFFNDHDPPHFHVRYQQFPARVRIEDGQVILRREALMKNWVAARTDGRLEWIEGLE